MADEITNVQSSSYLFFKIEKSNILDQADAVTNTQAGICQ